jgi:hypothetical protein
MGVSGKVSGSYRIGSENALCANCKWYRQYRPEAVLILADAGIGSRK